jgi:hypothetical protein
MWFKMLYSLTNWCAFNVSYADGFRPKQLPCVEYLECGGVESDELVPTFRKHLIPHRANLCFLRLFSDLDDVRVSVLQKSLNFYLGTQGQISGNHDCEPQKHQD